MTGHRTVRALATLALMLAVALPAVTPLGTAKKPRTSGALESLDWWARSRAYPERIVPGDRHAAEFERLREAAGGFDSRTARRGGHLATRPASPAAAGPAWRAMGPGNIGGRTLVVALDPWTPGTIWAGSASGGLWKSATGGVGVHAWTYVPTGFPVLSVSTIAFDLQNPGTLFLGTGEVYGYQSADGGLVNRTTRGSYGMGILKSTDGGVTWSKSLDWSRNQERGVWAVRVDPGNGQKVWAATTEGVYRSLDGGGTWTRVHAVIMAMDLEIDPGNGDRVYVGCGNLASTGQGVYRTTDGGATWTKLTNGIPGGFGGKVSLAIAPSNPNILYASIGNGSYSGAGTWLCRSANGGDSWTVMSATDYATFQGWYSHDVAVNPVNADDVVAVGIEVWRSTTGGASLAKISDANAAYFGVVPQGGPEGGALYTHADHHQVVFDPANPQSIYLATDGGIFRTTNGGASFFGANGGYQTSQFYAGFSNAGADTVPAMGGMQDNYTAIYSGTSAWSRVIGGDGCWTAIDSGNPQILYGSYQFLNILKSTDGGASFFPIAPPAAGNTAFIAPFILSPMSQNEIFAGQGTIVRSTNGGSSWQPGNQVNGRPILTIGASSVFSGLLYVTTEPAAGRFFYRTTNYGSTWTDRTGNLPDRYALDMSVDRSNDLVVHLVLSGYGTSHLWKTTNGGISWQDIGGALPDVPTSAVFVDPLNASRLFVGNDLGVFASYDGGATWGSFNTGLPEAVIVTDLTYVPSARRIRVSTHGNGVYEVEIPDVLTGVPVMPPPVASGLSAAPNPFSATTTLRFDLERGTAVTVEIFDVTGRTVRTLVRRADLSPGPHSVDWDGRTEEGEAAASGRYYARVSGAGEPVVRPITLVRR